MAKATGPLVERVLGCCNGLDWLLPLRCFATLCVFTNPTLEKSRASPAGSARSGLWSSRSSFNRRNRRISLGSEVSLFLPNESRRRLIMPAIDGGN